MREIDATVIVLSTQSMATMYLFDHETSGVQPRPARQWDRISLHGSLAAGSTGGKVANPSVSTAPGTVYLDHNLAGTIDCMPASFRIAPESSLSTPCVC